MTTRHMIYPPAAPAEDESYAEQTRRRAARWHAWLTSPHCTLQDRENFERWCADNGHGTLDDLMMPLDRALKSLL